MSLQTRNLRQVTELPLSQISRPIPPVLDYTKIDTMLSTLNGVPMASSTCPNVDEITAGELPPIDVLLVRENGKDRYFAFGGCHRFQAYEKKSRDTGKEQMVRCKVLPCTRKQLRVYLGNSVDKFFQD
ncbi:unnamed protein product [Kuraishia capsulata CBS 1993]|uniref:Sulfiredoxin n=1 Tax=Kuraishia capsulata CBS 1993 TaxID=1382522 RepID=W6MMJ2_9ASCO|nr:uncharacterized protein KUCA_T00003401001 [Kuraishia capsulata CBS 1993]CDK27423.1 unnamed protein product [Kuraishia capsulata CBS 1993]